MDRILSHLDLAEKISLTTVIQTSVFQLICGDEKYFWAFHICNYMAKHTFPSFRMDYTLWQVVNHATGFIYWGVIG